MGNFKKNQEKLMNNQVKLTNPTPLCKFEPPIKKFWIPPGLPLNSFRCLVKCLRVGLADKSSWTSLDFLCDHALRPI